MLKSKYICFYIVYFYYDFLVAFYNTRDSFLNQKSSDIFEADVSLRALGIIPSTVNFGTLNENLSRHLQFTNVSLHHIFVVKLVSASL